MDGTKKMVYTAACAALALVCLTISRYFPFLSFTPLMAAALCFFVAFLCGLYYGFLCIAATLILGFFITSGLNSAFLLTSMIFAPYSIIAFFIKSLTYKRFKNAIKRGAIVAILFNILLAALVFGLGKFLGENLFFGFEISSLIDYLGGIPLSYAALALFTTIFMIGFDCLFVIACQILRKVLKI